MSKLSKLIKNPRLFFSDRRKKRIAERAKKTAATKKIIIFNGKEQLVRGDIEKYIINLKNQNIKTLKELVIYEDLSFKKVRQPKHTLEKGHVFNPASIVFSKGGTPRFKYLDGYVSCNKENVELSTEPLSKTYLVINGKKQNVRNDIYNYITYLNGKNIKAKNDLIIYKDLGFKNPLGSNRIIKKGKVFSPQEIIISKGGTPRFKVQDGYVTTNKKHIQLTDEPITRRYLIINGKTQLVRDNIENYITEVNPSDRIEAITNLKLYTDKGFKHPVDIVVPKGSIFEPLGIEYTGGGTPRLVIHGGYTTANKNHVILSLKDQNLQIDITENKNNNINLSKVNKNLNYYYYFHCAESVDAGTHHLLSWMPIFLNYTDKENINFILVIRDYNLYKWAISTYPNANIAFIRRGVDMEELIQQYPSIRLVLYSSAHIKNGQIIRFNKLKHVFIGHGDSEKASSAHKGLRWFDEIWTAGQAHIDRFLNHKDINFKMLSFKKVGRPGLRNNLLKIKSDESNNFKKVLYLPTWEGALDIHQYFSVPIANDFIKYLITTHKLEISAKFHPFTGGRESNYNLEIEKIANKNKNLKIYNENTNLTNIIPNYDIFICDISSVVSECLSVHKPIFLYYPKDKEIELAPSNLPFNNYCYVFSTLEELKEKIHVLLTQGDNLKKNRKAAISYFLGLEETIHENMINEIKKS